MVIFRWSFFALSRGISELCSVNSINTTYFNIISSKIYLNETLIKFCVAWNYFRFMCVDNYNFDLVDGQP